jgi:hypothetical protein
VVYSGNSTRRYRLVYAKNLRLNKGVDNQIQFQFLNQEQKPFDITGKEITFRVINQDGTKVLLQKAVTPTLALNGICELLATSSDLIDIDPQLCSYSLEFNENGLSLPVFVNSDATARGTLQIVDSILPPHIPATEISIPTHPQPTDQSVTFYSSVFGTEDSPILSLQLYLDNYTGNVQVQGSTTVDSNWYNIGSSFTYQSETSSQGLSVNGFHPYLRVKFDYTQGDITKILAR